jgi:hypothetical protein
MRWPTNEVVKVVLLLLILIVLFIIALDAKAFEF